MVEILVKSRDKTKAGFAEAAASAEASGSAVERIWAAHSDNIGKHLKTVMGNSLKGIGGLAGGALGLGLTGPFAAAGLAVAGFAAVAIPELTKVEGALGKTGKAGQKAWQQLDPGERALGTSIRTLEKSFNSLVRQMEPVVAQVLNLAVKTVQNLMPAIQKLAPVGAKVISDFLIPLNKLLASPFFATFIKQMSQLAIQVAPVLAQTLLQLLVVFMKLFMQAGPAAVKILQQLLPAIVQIVAGLVPFITAVTNITAATITWLAKNHLLIPALTLLGAALTAVFLIMDANPVMLLITALALLVGGLTALWKSSLTFRKIVTTVFSDVGQVALTFAEIWLNEMHAVADIFLSVVGIIIHGAAAAFGWVPGVGGKLRTAAAAFDGFRKGVDDVFNKAHDKIEGWKRDLANMPKKVALQGDISDLTNKLNSAKAQLKDPNLTATRRAKVLADIHDLIVNVAAAKRQLDALNGYTAYTYVTTIQTGGGTKTLPKGFASGGVIGAAGGGPRGNLVLVGESGPELVRLPPGSMVNSSPDTQRMLSQGGTGGRVYSITVNVPPNVNLAEVGRQTVNAIREFERGSGRGWRS